MIKNVDITKGASYKIILKFKIWSVESASQ